jgi:hypothetical protein
MENEAWKFPELTIPADKFRQLEEVVTERNRIRQLIEKAKAGKVKVKEQIFQKVISGYETQMAEVVQKYEPVREEIANLLREIRQREADIRAEFTSANDQVEELRFRCEVGEFSPEDLAAREAEHKNHIGALETKLKVVEDTYGRCRQYLGDDDFNDAVESGGSSEAPPAGEPESEVIGAPPAAEAASADVEIVSAPDAGQDIDIQSAPAPDVEIGASDDIVIQEGEPVPAPPPPPPPAAKARPAPKAPAPPPPPPAPKAPPAPPKAPPPPPKPAGRPAAPPPPPRPAPPSPLEEGNPEMTLAEPIPFASSEEAANPDSTLDGGPVPGAPSKGAADIEATISFQQRSVLHVLKADGKTDTYLLGSDPLSIGRHHTNDIVLLDRSISRKHAEVKKEAEGYVMTDMSSGGGFIVNGEKKKRTVLKSGDELVIGEFKLVYKEEMGI